MSYRDNHGSGLHDFTISSYYIRAVRTESRSKRQFGYNLLLFTAFKTVWLDSRPRVNEAASCVADLCSSADIRTTFEVISVFSTTS